LVETKYTEKILEDMLNYTQCHVAAATIYLILTNRTTARQFWWAIAG
jgi:hypothetical protein